MCMLSTPRTRLSTAWTKPAMASVEPLRGGVEREFIKAAERGNLKPLHGLLQRDSEAAARCRDGKGRSACHVAARDGHVTAAELLYNCNPAVFRLRVSETEQTPGHLAAR